MKDYSAEADRQLAEAQRNIFAAEQNERRLERRADEALRSSMHNNLSVMQHDAVQNEMRKDPDITADEALSVAKIRNPGLFDHQRGGRR
jgi:predicted RNA methylase